MVSLLWMYWEVLLVCWKIEALASPKAAMMTRLEMALMMMHTWGLRGKWALLGKVLCPRAQELPYLLFADYQAGKIAHR